MISRISLLDQPEKIFEGQPVRFRLKKALDQGLIGRLQRALGSYQDEFMEDFSLEDAPEFGLWLGTGRTRWLALFGELCTRVSRLDEEKGF